MKTKQLRPGFTLIELLVAMSITVVLLGILVYMTGISMETFKKSRNEVRASRQAKEAIEVLAKDFESMIAHRNGKDYEWLNAQVMDTNNVGPNGNNLLNACELIFFTGATDRYNGQIGTPGIDKGGDVSVVGYRLAFKDQISGNNDYAVFSLYRHLVNPDEAYEKLLTQPDLNATGVFTESSDLTAPNFLVENIYEFTLTFLVETSTVNSQGVTTTNVVRASIKPDALTSFRVKGTGIKYTGNLPSGVDEEAFKNGSIVGVEISITVITDQGLTIARRVSKATWEKQQNKYTYHYSKTIMTPRP